MKHHAQSPRTENLLQHRAARRTQREMAALFGVSRARIYQIEHAALEKLRRAIVREAKQEGVSVEVWLGEEE